MQIKFLDYNGLSHFWGAVKTKIDTKQDTSLKFSNVSASNWVSDSTYTDFPYRCDIECPGVTSNMYAEVVFSHDIAIGGKYSPVCETKTDMVSIWSMENASITIPTIIITK